MYDKINYITFINTYKQGIKVANLNYNVFLIAVRNLKDTDTDNVATSSDIPNNCLVWLVTTNVLKSIIIILFIFNTSSSKELFHWQSDINKY